ncbi:hypothetical protein ROZALSC1DRAFT_29460, partial [Rozella allomycis CSF55]
MSENLISRLDHEFATLLQLESLGKIGIDVKDLREECFSNIMSLQTVLQLEADHMYASTLESMDKNDVDILKVPNLEEYPHIEYYDCEQQVPDELICLICSDNVSFTSAKDKKEGFKIDKCDHIYCAECFSHWLKLATEDRSFRFPLICPAENCQTTIEPTSQMDPILDDATFDSFRKRYLEATGRAIYCPEKTCSTFMALRSDARFIQCTECRTGICVSCKVKDHRPLQCVDFQNLPIEYRNPDDVTLHMAVKEHDWRYCPSCKAAVEKKTGCNFVSCLCGVGFCYKCGKQYKNLIENERNTHGEPDCTCGLFDVPQGMEGDEDDEDEEDDDEEENPDAHFNHHNDMNRNRYGQRYALFGVTDIVWMFENAPNRLPPWLYESYRDNVCHYCQRRFLSLRSLQAHLLTTRDHEVLFCCGRTFKDVRGLRNHA